MAHVRKAVRDWLKTNLAGSTLAAGRVFVRRTLPLEKDFLPTLLIAVTGERSRDASNAYSQERSIEFRVTACIKADGEAAEDSLDSLCVYVEKQVATMGAGVQTVEYQATEFAFDAAGERTLATAALTFVAVVYTARTDPETAL